MPAPLTVFADAKARLTTLVQPSVEPTLTTTAGGEIETALNDNQVASLWAANTAYKVGDIVQPTANNRTGLRYRCVKKGSSHATTEPTWPEYEGGRVSDGTTLVWEEYGIERDLWDIRAAAKQCWELKASKASDYSDNTVGGDHSDRESQVYDHCIAMAARFAPVGV